MNVFVRHIMLHSKRWIRCSLFGWLFFFAATADFIATSVISGGYNANNPPVRIEHKCVGHAPGMCQKRINLTPAHHTGRTYSNLRQAIDQGSKILSSAITSAAALPAELSPPLRC